MGSMKGAFLTLFIESCRHSKNVKSLRNYCRQEIGLTNDVTIDKICSTLEILERRINFYLLQTTRYDSTQGQNNNKADYAKFLGPTKMKGPTKAKNDRKGAYNGKNEEKGAYEGQNEGNKLQKIFCSANIKKVPRAYETLNPALIQLTY